MSWDGHSFVEGLGTVRRCVDCDALVGGGPTRCGRCARIAGLPAWKRAVLRFFGVTR